MKWIINKNFLNFRLQFKQTRQNFPRESHLAFVWSCKETWKLPKSSQSVRNRRQFVDRDFTKFTIFTASLKVVDNSAGICLHTKACLWIQQWVHWIFSLIFFTRATKPENFPVIDLHHLYTHPHNKISLFHSFQNTRWSYRNRFSSYVGFHVDVQMEHILEQYS
jgi:hypothetical protein